MNQPTCPIPFLPASLLAAIALGAALAAQSVDRAGGDAASARVRGSHAGVLPAHVVFDQPGDGRIWALGATYKASFGGDGFTYVPFFGSAAPRNFPVQFLLRAVRVDGRSLGLAGEPGVARDGACVTLDRGPVREVYDLAADAIEQTFVVATALAGDIEIELEVATELVEDAGRPGLQFANELGAVDYGTAYVVTDAGKTEIATDFGRGTVRLHVPAAKRPPAGPVVVDPIIRTRSMTPTLMNSEIPDPAYDATTDRWAVTWVHVFSQADHDVVVELRDGNGDPVAGSFQGVEISGSSYSWPRIANLNSADRFLVAMERFVASNPAGQQYTVWCRTVDAAAPFTRGGLTQLSPSTQQDHRSVDVGGDPGAGTKWTVVWVHGSDILARQVDASGVPNPNTIPIETSAAPCIEPQISLSNGNGQTATPRWCVVYNLLNGSSDWDVYGAMVDENGLVTQPHAPIASGADIVRYPYVSSAATDLFAGPAFLVCYELQTNPTELLARLVDERCATIGSEINLTRRYGLTGVFGRVETDGLRFAATCLSNGSVRVATLAWVNNDMVLHESPQGITTGSSPHLASKHSGGGTSIDYGIVCRHQSTPTGITFCLYEGRTPAGGTSWRDTGCDGLWLDWSGEPYVGRSMHFVVQNGSPDFAGVAFGLPSATNPLCSGCRIGLDLAAPVTWSPGSLTLQLPSQIGLVGVRLAVQGFVIGSGSCQPLGLRVSDTLDVTAQ